MVSQASVRDIHPRFLALCERYLENPEILTGLELDELVVRFKQAVLDELKAPALATSLFELRRVIPRRDPEAFRRLLDEVLDGLAAHGIT